MYKKGWKAPKVQTASKESECSRPGCTLPILPGEQYVRVMRMAGRTHKRGSGATIPSALYSNGIEKYHVGCANA